VKGTQKTATITLNDVRFFLGKSEIQHFKGIELNALLRANVVAITFWLQKNLMKYTTIPMHKSGCTIMCPMRAWARIIHYLWNQKYSHDNTPVYAYWFRDGSMHPFMADETFKYLQNLINEIGSDELGIK